MTKTPEKEPSRGIIKNNKIALKTIPFNVELFDFTYASRNFENYSRLHCPDWVNVFAQTQDQEIILIRQFRAGSFCEVLETPGGCLDEGEDPISAGLRELEEETGYTSKDAQSMLTVFANPAIQSNKIHFIAALNCYKPKQRQFFPDEHENIEVRPTPRKDLKKMMQNQQIQHCFSVLALNMGLALEDSY